MNTDLIIDAISVLHLLAVVVGLGAAMETEHFAFRYRNRTLTDGYLAAIHKRHTVVSHAVLAMWATGAAILSLRTGFESASFSPKLLAKLCVVTILTINGLFIARIALPILIANRGQTLAGLRVRDRGLLFAMAGVSGESWVVALTLGAADQLKMAPADLFVTAVPAIYAAAILAALCIGFASLDHKAPVAAHRAAGQAFGPLPEGYT